MKIRIIFLLAIAMFYSELSYSQFATTNNEDLSFIIDESFTDITDPEKNYPDCAKPSELKVSQHNGSYQISWDGELDLNFDYEYRFESDISRNVNVHQTKVKNVEILENWKEFAVRRLCKDKQGNIIYSEWSSIQEERIDELQSSFVYPCENVLEALEISVNQNGQMVYCVYPIEGYAVTIQLCTNIGTSNENCLNLTSGTKNPACMIVSSQTDIEVTFLQHYTDDQCGPYVFPPYNSEEEECDQIVVEIETSIVNNDTTTYVNTFFIGIGNMTVTGYNVNGQYNYGTENFSYSGCAEVGINFSISTLDGQIYSCTKNLEGNCEGGAGTNSEEFSCEDVIFSFDNSNSTIESRSSNSYCEFQWSSDEPLDAIAISYNFEGIQYSLDLSGDSGSVSIPNGANVDVTFSSGDVHCSRSVLVSCIGDSDNEELCDQFSSSFTASSDSSSGLCDFEWSVPIDISLQLTICLTENGVETCTTETESNGIIKIPQGVDITYYPFLEKEDENGEMITSACIGQSLSCEYYVPQTCSDLIFVVSPLDAVYSSGSHQIHDCSVSWTSTNNVQAKLSYLENGVFNKHLIENDFGFFTVDSSTVIHIDYIINNDEVCSQTVIADCLLQDASINPPSTEELCAAFEYEFSDLGGLGSRSADDYCSFSWSLPDSLSLNMTICNGIDCITYNDNSGSLAFYDGVHTIEYQVLYTDEYGNTVVADCENFDIECNIEDEPIDDEAICEILGILQASVIDESNMFLGFYGESDGYFQDALLDLGYTSEFVQQQFELIQTIELIVEYRNIDNPATTSYTYSQDLTVNGVFSLGVNQSIEDWVIPFEGVSPENFEGKFRFSIVSNDGVIIECDNQPLNLIIEDTDTDEEPPLISLPDFECGEDVPPVDITTEKLLDKAEIGQIFTIKNFPILICDLTLNGPGKFSGSGILPTPFNKKTAIVDFNNVTVNQDYQIIDGFVEVRGDDPANYPNFAMNPDTLSIGGDICLPPEIVGYDDDGYDSVNGLNDYGFNEDGKHPGTNTPYDFNGYDVNGDHSETGSPYNLCGCTRDGIDVDGNPCDPACPGDPSVQVFVDSITVVINDNIAGVLEGLKGNLADSLANLNCDNYRNEMNALLTTLGYNRDFVLGENDKYFNQGMHKEFESEPKVLNLNTDRDADAVALEEQHVLLYKCDKSEAIVNLLLPAIQDLCNIDPDSENPLIDHILSQIQGWSKYQAELYSDPDKFLEWLTTEVQNYIQSENGIDDYFGAINPNLPYGRLDIRQKVNSIFNFDRSNSSYNAIVSRDHYQTFSSNALEELSFEFKQDREYINGHHRAIILEELHHQQMDAGGNLGASLLPISLSKQVGSYVYTIYLDKVKFSTSGAVLNAYCIITDPETGKKIVFKAEDVAFGASGLTQESKLSLLTDIEIRLNNAAMLRLKASEDTFVSWDCNGFAGMGVDTDIDFCRNFVIPLNPSTLQPLPESERYSLSVKAEIPAWLEFTAEVTAAPFAIAQYSDIKWSLDNMILDFSSSATPEFTPPEGYKSEFYSEDNGFSPLWKGFYLKSLTAKVEGGIGASSEPIIVQAADVLIDGTGVSGAVNVGGILSMDEGNMGGWPFSIESFELRVLHNQFAGAGLGGEIKVPIFKEAMGYSATMYPNNKYEFTVEPLANATMDMLFANAEIYSSSKITVGYNDGEVIATATLNGKLSMDPEDENNKMKLQFPDATFTGFQISNQAPYFSPGTWGISGNNVSVSMGGFGLDVKNITPYSPEEGYAGFMFNLDLTLSDNIDISANGDVGVLGKLEIDDKGRQKWVFDSFDMRSFCLEGSFPGVKKINGCIDWYPDGDSPDPVYGEGFRGSVYIKFDKFDAEVAAVAQFGKVDGYKYFFVDALANLNLGIGVGPFTLDGFGGGISNNMTTSFDAQNVDLSTATDILNVPPLIGSTFSGVVYTPYEPAGLGIKGSVLFSILGNKEAFNGVASLEFLFNDNNGINKIAFRGAGQLLSFESIPLPAENAPDNESPAPSIPMAAIVSMELNFAEPSFHGDLIVFLDAGIITGDPNNNNKLVDASFHFDPEKWYINVGTPDQPANASLNLPLVGSVAATAYFDIGTQVPAMPPLPNEVRELVGKVSNNSSLRRSGSGFVFGAALNFNLKIEAGPAKATLKAGAGFDIMLRKYEGYSCAGSSEPVGINGWYASGQLWAYITGSVDLWGINIMKAGIAAVLQARLPNPVFIEGAVGMKVKLLFVTKHVTAKFSLGDDCTLVSSTGEDVALDVISYIDPIDGTKNMPTTAVPKVHFNIPYGKSLDIQDINGNNISYNTRNFVATLTYQGIEIPVENIYDPESNTMSVHPKYMLPSNDSIFLEVFVDVVKDGVVDKVETQSVSFFIGDGLTTIPPENIVCTYPTDGMRNFYKKEHKHQKGFVVLKQGQPELLYDIPYDVKQVIRVTSSDGDVNEIEYEYDPFNNRIEFILNPNIFTNEAFYKLELIRIPLIEESDDRGVESNPNQSQNNQPLLTVYFRVSKYDTFEDKINAIKSLSANSIVSTESDEGQLRSGSSDDILRIKINGTEAFDILEANGDEFLGLDRLVKFSLNYKNLNWFNTMNADLYSHLPAELDLTNYSQLAGEGVCNGGGFGISNFESKDYDDPLKNSVEIKLPKGIISSDHFASPPTSPLFHNIGNRHEIANSMFFTGKDHYNIVKDQVSTCIMEISDFCASYNGLDRSKGNGDEEDFENCLEDIIGPKFLQLSKKNPPVLPSGEYNARIMYFLPDGHKNSDFELSFNFTNN